MTITSPYRIRSGLVCMNTRNKYKLFIANIKVNDVTTDGSLCGAFCKLKVTAEAEPVGSSMIL